MKPIWQIILTLTLVMIVESQKFQQEQYPFPPHFQTPSASIFSSDSTIYLPPESSTPISYFPANNINKYPIKFLPPTAIKAPSIYPTPYPMVSSTLRSNFENEDSNLKDISKLRSSPLHHIGQIDKNVNNTENNMRQQVEKREMRTIQRVPNFQQKFENLNNFDHVLNKAQYPTGTIIQTQNAPNQNPASRRMIVTSEIQRNDNGLDQVKSASFANAQYIQAPGVIIASTAEPAIPILRLSNEMDLDGSFSYEALGADQTHYVQHSRMENMGTDKEEQVVEGSYSYVGDNGQTYTVHYVADSNGYRASGDHLPVAPPIPEIIQRAIQYNLAEEARNPPHLKQSWENENKDYENDESSNRYSITSLRNLFTGRTPEAFSFGFPQGANTQNNLVSAASSNVPIKTSYDIISDQFKSKSNNPITPQITFLASQGAHNPSSQPQQVASRVVSTEKSTLPQLVNYEASIKESDPEANKGLWRWQYGSTTNDNSSPNKNTISRSSGEGDEVIINFNDMTAEQYTKMIHSQISDQKSAASSKFLDNTKINNNYNKANVNYPLNNEPNAINGNNIDNDKTRTQNNFQNFKNQDINNTPLLTDKPVSSTTMINSDAQNNEFNDFFNSENPQNVDSTDSTIYSKIISRQSFLPKSNIVTQTYNFEDITDDISQEDILKNNPGIIKSTIDKENIAKSETNHPVFSNIWINNINEGISSTNLPMISTTDNSLKILELESIKNDFKPVTIFDNYYEKNSSPTTTESIVISDEQMINENIFLKNLLKPKANEYTVNKFHNTSQKDAYIPDNYEAKEEKVAKILEYQPNTQNEIKFNQKKPFDVNDVLNYVALKNNFESSKTRPKNIASINFSHNFNQKDIRPVRYITNFDNSRDNEDNNKEDENDTYQVKNNQKKEIPGIIKNYKVLQRQRNAGHSNNNHFSELPHRNIKTFHNLGLPPLGRAGPSLKSYLPPTFL